MGSLENGKPWLARVRNEYEIHASAADSVELPSVSTCIERLRLLEELSMPLRESDRLFLGEVAIQLALWDEVEGGKATWRMLAANDLARAAKG